MTHSPELAILQTSDSQHRMITARQIGDLGISDKVCRRLARNGFLVSIRRGLYRVGGSASTHESAIAGLLLSMPGAAAYRRTAARLHDIAGPWSERVEVAVPRGRAHQIDGTSIHETLHLPRADLTEVRGLACTTVERTLVDLVKVASPQRMRWMLEVLGTEGRVSEAGLRSCFLHYARRGRPGTVAMRGILDHFLAREDIDATHLERAFADLCRFHGLVGFVRQFRPPWYDGVRGIVDNAVPHARLIVETDGRAWHTISQALSDDRHRDRAAALHGWRAVRYDYDEIVHRPTEVAAEIRQLLEMPQAA